MVQSVGINPFLASYASVDQRRPSEEEPDSNRITPATAAETAAPDKRRPDPSDSPATAPRLPRDAYTAKYGLDTDGFPLQLARGDQVTQAEAADARAIAENRISQEETRAALIQAQEARDDATEATRRQQEAVSARRDAAQAERNDSAQQERQAESVDLPAIVENRTPQEENRAALIQAQEARDDAVEATQRQQEAVVERRDAAQAERRDAAEAVQSERRDETEQSRNQQRTAGSFLDLQV